MRTIIPVFVAAASIVACASYPMPVQRLADAEAATRSAAETGAATVPQARLHLKLAHEGIARANALIADGENRRADYELLKAKTDAELALAETRDRDAHVAATKVIEEVDAVHAHGAASTSVTTTTNATVTKTPSTSRTTTTTTEEKP